MTSEPQFFGSRIEEIKTVECFVSDAMWKPTQNIVVQKMSDPRYSALHQHDVEWDDKASDHPIHCEVPCVKRRTAILIASILCLSLLFNLYSIFQLRPSFASSNQAASKFAGLHRNVPTEILKHSDYHSPNRTIEDTAWDSPALLPENGFIALKNEWAAVRGLPSSQPWPWDAGKSVYIITGSHEIHCVHIVRQSVNEAHDMKAQSWSHQHVMHCINVLRESIMCNADDTPLYTGRIHHEKHAASPRAGIGTVKMCRSWDKLQAFAREHSACWGRAGLDDPNFPTVERYKFCPDGSRPWEGKPAMGAYENHDTQEP